jgi:heat shock protein HslJ
MPPSVGKSIWLLLDPETLQFGEVEQNFEGEADSSRMSLNMKTWVFVSALYNDGREITPEEEGIFTLTFEDGNRFSATTDCNNMGGNYRTEGSTISFSEIISTKMYCEGSKESEFAELLTNAAVYSFTSRGELILDLKFDSGSAIFR